MQGPKAPHVTPCTSVAAPRSRITTQQLNHILATGKLPNGDHLEDYMREAIEKKLNDFMVACYHSLRSQPTPPAVHDLTMQWYQMIVC